MDNGQLPARSFCRFIGRFPLLQRGPKNLLVSRCQVPDSFVHHSLRRIPVRLLTDRRSYGCIGHHASNLFNRTAACSFWRRRAIRNHNRDLLNLRSLLALDWFAALFRLRSRRGARLPPVPFWNCDLLTLGSNPSFTWFVALLRFGSRQDAGLRPMLAR